MERGLRKLHEWLEKGKRKELKETYKEMYLSIGKYDFDLSYIEDLISLCEKMGYEEKVQTVCC